MKKTHETMYRNGEHKLKRLVFPLVYIVRKFEKEKEDKTMKNYGNTLLGYFKSGLDRNHCSIKYFNREFLAIFISEYNDSMKNGVANYEKTKTTRFYNENGGSYCVFLELWNEYKQGIERAKTYGF